MSKRSSESANFIGSFWNIEQHRPDPKIDPAWPERAFGFVRAHLRQSPGASALEDAANLTATPRRLVTARGTLAEARWTLDLLEARGHSVDTQLSCAVDEELRAYTESIRRFSPSSRPKRPHKDRV